MKEAAVWKEGARTCGVQEKLLGKEGNAHDGGIRGNE